MKDKEKFASYLGFFLLSVVVGSAAIYSGLRLRKRRRFLIIRWKKAGGIKRIAEQEGDVFALVIGGILLHVGKVVGSLKESAQAAVERRYGTLQKAPRNLKIYVATLSKGSPQLRGYIAPLLVSMLQPPWNLPEEGEYTGPVPIELRSEGEIPPGVKAVLKL
ncbi:MAG: hypothetical protein GXO39_07335 [Thermotogae bacterium]|nr:hypothetical protein [Thermotogota bacterium]